MARLEEGQLAPEFSIKDVAGKKISLKEFEGKHTLLSFMRYAGCPFCNLTLIQLVERYQNFSSRGLEVISFFQSPKSTIDEYVMAKNPPFSIVSDPKKDIYDLYGIESSKVGAIKSIPVAAKIAPAYIKGQVKQGTIDGDGFLMPAQFIVGPDLCLKKVYYGTDFGDKIPFFEIERILLTELDHSHIA